MEGLKLTCLKIPLVSPLGLMEYLINQNYIYPLYYYQIGPGAPLGHLPAALRAIIIICTSLPLYIKLLYTVASRG